MSVLNPLAATPDESALVRAIRLHMLTRDAYLSPSGTSCHKLVTVADLARVAALTDLDALLPPSRALLGVRLVTALRESMAALAHPLAAPACGLALLDAVTSTREPATGWSRSPAYFAADAAVHAGIDATPSRINQLQRHHRAARSHLAGVARAGRSAVTLPGPLAAVAEMIGEVHALAPAHALAAGAVSLAGGVMPPSLPSAGVIFDRMPTPREPALNRYVGTAVARVTPEALIHHLATLDVACLVHPGLRSLVGERLAALAHDLSDSPASSDAEQARMEASRRAVESLRRRLGGRAWLRWAAHSAERRLGRAGNSALTQA